MAGIEVWTQHLVAHGDRGAFRRLLEPGRRCRLRRVVLPLEADLAARLCFVYPRWRIDDGNVLSYLPGVLLVIMLALAWWRRPYVGPTGRDADRLLRGTAAAGAGFREHLLHALLVGGGSLAVCGHDRALRGVAGAAATLARRRLCRPADRLCACVWGCWRRWRL